MARSYARNRRLAAQTGIAQALAESERRLRELFGLNPQPMWIYDLESGRFLLVNQAATQLYGYTADEFAAMVTTDILAHDLAKAPRLARGAEITAHARKDGSLIEVRLTSRTMRWNDRLARLVVVNDVTEQRRQESRDPSQLHDPLTGLPNRGLLLERLGQAMQRASRGRADAFSVLILDFDNFSNVNGSIGHLAGDAVLIEAGRRLRDAVRARHTVARLSADAFIVLLEGVYEREAMAKVAPQVQAVLAPAFVADGHELLITTSAGIAPFTRTHTHPEDILRDAEIALAQAQRGGGNRSEVFDPTMHTRYMRWLAYQQDLRRAVAREEFRVHYQPIVSLKDGHIAGFEALARWEHPERGLVPPAEFIPVAEDTGIIQTISESIWRQSCRQLGAWHTELPGMAHITVNVNMSAKNFVGATITDTLTTILAQTGLPPTALKVEITESVLMQQHEAAAALDAMRALGLRLCMDDFGTGYSSLSYLHRFAFDTLKIDRSFVARLGDANEDVEIVRAIVTLAHNLGMDVVAEGIETATQRDRLEALGCDYGQGYYFSPPVPPEEAGRLLAAPTGGWNAA